MPRGLCIGGPADGEWLESNNRFLVWPKKINLRPYYEASEVEWDAPEIIAHTEEYRLELFRAGGTFAIYMWVPKGMSIEDAVTKLFKGYKP